METITLKRKDYNADGTFGELYFRGKLVAVTCEPEWRDNGPNSCIPVGQYTFEAYTSEKFPQVWQIMDVPDRDKILLHAGNVEDNSRGCVLCGELLGFLDGKHAVLNSKVTLAKLRGILPSKGIIIIEDDL